MSDRPSDSSGLRSGDPLGGEAGVGPAPDAPREPWPGYVSPPPPGAGGPPAPWAGSSPSAVSGQHVLAGWWRRVGAQLIDGFIIVVGAILLVIAITAPFSIGFAESEDAGLASIAIGLVIAILAVTVISLVYAPWLMARTNGKTLGRMATGIRVVRADGRPLTFGFAMLREVAVKALLFGTAGSFTFGLATLLDALWPLWDDENRALHDFVVNTRTILD